MSDEQVVALVRACPFAVGVKSETPPTSAAIAHIAPLVDVPVFGGLGGVGLLDELAADQRAPMTGFSHPAALAAVLNAWEQGGVTAARDTWAPWLPLANFEGQLKIGLAIRREVLRRRGVIASSRVRPPARTLPASLTPTPGPASCHGAQRHVRNSIEKGNHGSRNHRPDRTGARRQRRARFGHRGAARAGGRQRRGVRTVGRRPGRDGGPRRAGRGQGPARGRDLADLAAVDATVTAVEEALGGVRHPGQQHRRAAAHPGGRPGRRDLAHQLRADDPVGDHADRQGDTRMCGNGIGVGC